jgi:hypothetical protein
MPRGGKRIGAGRQWGSKEKRTIERATVRAYFEAQALAEFKPIFAAYVRRAKGEPTDADPRILIDFFNRLLGKPPDWVQLSGVDGGPVHVSVERISYRELKE